MGALQKTCTWGVDGVGIWGGASSLTLVKRLESGFALEMRGFRDEKGGRAREGAGLAGFLSL